MSAGGGRLGAKPPGPATCTDSEALRRLWLCICTLRSTCRATDWTACPWAVPPGGEQTQSRGRTGTVGGEHQLEARRGGPLPGALPVGARRQPVPVRADRTRGTAFVRHRNGAATWASCPVRYSTGSTSGCRCTRLARSLRAGGLGIQCAGAGPGGQRPGGCRRPLAPIRLHHQRRGQRIGCCAGTFVSTPPRWRR